jgi:hypothetical protein
VPSGTHLARVINTGATFTHHAHIVMRWANAPLIILCTNSIVRLILNTSICSQKSLIHVLHWCILLITTKYPTYYHSQRKETARLECRQQREPQKQRPSRTFNQPHSPGFMGLCYFVGLPSTSVLFGGLQSRSVHVHYHIGSGGTRIWGHSGCYRRDRGHCRWG